MKYPHRSLTCLAAAVFVCCTDHVTAQRGQDWRPLANQMVEQEIIAAGVKDERVLAAVRSTPRHEFVPVNQRKYAYFDMALPIGNGQTISPPFIVASMTEAIDPQPGDRVLEIGTGSGYQAAVLSPLAKEVYTIEIVEPLGRRATRTLHRLGYENVHVRIGDGYKGWLEAAPFDKIIVTCSPEKVPQPLVDQLRDGGLIVIPVGQRYQQTLYLMRKQGDKLSVESLRPTLFVPMTGEAEAKREVLPDPALPRLNNGSFEQLLGQSSSDGSRQPAGWHYQRQLAVDESRDAPDGQQHVVFRNAIPGRGSQALQGFPIDGRLVSALEVQLWARGADVRSSESPEGATCVVVTFYDERRTAVGDAATKPFAGSFAWQERTERLRVPLRAREAIIRIGLLGATGEIAFDNVRIRGSSSASDPEAKQ